MFWRVSSRDEGLEVLDEERDGLHGFGNEGRKER